MFLKQNRTAAISKGPFSFGLPAQSNPFLSFGQQSNPFASAAPTVSKSNPFQFSFGAVPLSTSIAKKIVAKKLPEEVINYYYLCF